MVLTSRDRELKAIAESYGIKRVARVDRVAIKVGECSSRCGCGGLPAAM